MTAPSAAGRIASLDVVRGVAVLGILLMNIVGFGLGISAYFNLAHRGSDTFLDRAVGVCGELLADQKFMAVFSLLFGAGIVLFHERATAKGRNGVTLSLWRNALLLLIGLAHATLWEGDVLTVYAVCAPVLIAARRLADRTLVWLAIAIVALSPLFAMMAQDGIDATGSGLGEYWGVAGAMNDEVGLWLLVDFFGRALSLMLIGIVLYRNGFLAGRLPREVYVRTLCVGGTFGLAAAATGVALLFATGFAPEVAVVASIPNTIGTIPSALALVSAILLAMPHLGRMHDRLAAVGRMALTNYLLQTVLGLLILRVLVGGPLGRLALLGVAVLIWGAQIALSVWWLERFRYGPIEWLWRAATYRALPPFRR